MDNISTVIATHTRTSSKEDVLATQHSTEDGRLLFIQLPGWQTQDGLLTWVGLHLKWSSHSRCHTLTGCHSSGYMIKTLVIFRCFIYLWLCVNWPGWSCCHSSTFWPAVLVLQRWSCWCGLPALQEPLCFSARWPSGCLSAAAGWWPRSCGAGRLSASPAQSEACCSARPGVWCSGFWERASAGRGGS